MPNLHNDEFQRALDEARRQAHAPGDDTPGPRSGPRVRARLDFSAASGSGGEARFGLALEWTEEPADRQAPAPAGEPPAGAEDTPAEIAAALGLTGSLTLDQLAARWRDFVWRNHPDRQPAHARRRANARVAIANTLYDRARRELAERR